MWPFTKRSQAIPTKVYPECEFNIERLQVFLIERDTKEDITIISCLGTDGNIGNFTLPVSPAAHDALVRRFRAKLGLSTTSTTQPSTT